MPSQIDTPAPTPDGSAWPDRIADVDALEEVLSRPSAQLVADLAALDGDIMILGAGGKIGPSLARMARRAAPDKRVIAVARMSTPGTAEAMEAQGIETVRADLLDRSAIAALPKCQNVLFLAGRKFGSAGALSLTWAMNSFVPALVAEAFYDSRIIAYSTGCVYPFVPVIGGGATEDLAPDPPGEYAQSCVGRERMFEYFSERHGTPGRLFRLNYAVEMRYGVLVDIGQKVLEGEPVDATMGHVNVIWQGDANEMALRSLNHVTVPTTPINVTGPETLSVRWVAEEFARRFDKTANVTGSEASHAWLNNAARAHALFGYPKISVHLLLDWTADWLKRDGELLGKPTKFEVRDGAY